MMWWPFFIFAASILLNSFVIGVPVPQLPFLQLPQSPSLLNYIGLERMPGGTQHSLLNATFTPDQIVTTSGMATNPYDTGLPAFGDLSGSGFIDLGRGLATGLSSFVGS